jgi:hypothetical protein
VDLPFDIEGMQKWDGRVVEVDIETGTFTARLSSPDSTSLLADFESRLLGDDSPPVEGDVVYVTVRTIAGPNGYPTRTSGIRLRRLGNWSEDDVVRHITQARSELADLEGIVDFD